MELGTLMAEILDRGVSMDSVIELRSAKNEFNLDTVYVNEENNISISLDLITKDYPKKETKFREFVSEIFGQREVTKKSEVFLGGETEEDYVDFDIEEIVRDGDKIALYLEGGDEEDEVYDLACNNCNTDFEVESDDVGYPPFTAECPNCGAEIDYD